MEKIFNELENSYNSANVIEQYQIKASRIAHANRINRKYTYWIKTPHGMRLDDFNNDKYNTTREDYDKWRKDNPYYQVGVSGKISLRPIVNTKNKKVIGYITEEELNNDLWKQDIKKLISECFKTLCEELQVTDIDNFRYFIFNNDFISHNYELNDYDYKLEKQLDVMVLTYEYYKTEEDFKKLIDKIKV